MELFAWEQDEWTTPNRLLTDHFPILLRLFTFEKPQFFPLTNQSFIFSEFLSTIVSGKLHVTKPAFSN